MRFIFGNEFLLKTSKKYHNELVEHISKAPQHFFDQNPTGRILVYYYILIYI